MTLFAAFHRHFIGRVATLGLATFLSAFLSLALLPIATRELHASDYGTYALLMSLVTLVSSAMDGGSSLFLPSVYHGATPRERGQLFATAAAIAITGGLAIGALAIVIAHYFHAKATDAAIPMNAILIATVMVPFRSIGVIASAIFSITNRGHAIALQTIVHATGVFLFTIIALFWLSLGGTALIFGAACGQIASTLVSLFILHRHRELLTLPSRRWLRRSLQHALTSSTFGFMSGAHSFVENSLLTAVSGLRAAGFTNHARLYFNFTLALVGTVGQNVRAASLEEAREPASDFTATRKAWTPVHIALTFVGIFFALFGEWIVNVVSNGKLIEAAPYIPFFMIIAIIQNCGQAATVTMYASGKSSVAARLQTALTLAGLVALFPLVGKFGIPGILGVIIVESIVYRIAIARLARKLRSIPFQDTSAYFGCLLILSTTWWVNATLPTTDERIAWMIGGLASIMIVGRRSAAETIAEILHLIRFKDKKRKTV